MFVVHVFQTREIGRIVTHRLPAKSGGLGDITATRDGIVVSGQFDLKTPEAQMAFLSAFQQAQAVLPTLQPGATIPNPESIPHPRGSSRVGQVEVTELEAEDVLPHRPSPLAAARQREEPLTVGRRALRTQCEFSTVVAKSDDDGKEQFYCAICRAALKPSDSGWIFKAGSVTQIGIYQPFGQESDNPPMILEASANPRHGVFGSVDIKQGETWIHSCSSLGEQKFRMLFRLPELVDRIKS